MAADETLRPPDLSVLSAGHEDRLVAKHHFQVITPIFGGSAESRKVDPNRPIREASIRGNLRSWWRATRGAQYSSDDRLFEAEAAIFGSTETPSPFDVLVEVTESGKTQPCAKYSGSSTPQFAKDHPSYALFPFQGQTRGGQVTQAPDHGLYDVRFTLSLVAKRPQDLGTVREELGAALWAWATFGGYGSRTRRGCGSLLCSDLAPADANDLVAMSRRYLARGDGGASHGILQGARVVMGRPSDDGVRAWKQAVEAYRDLRQGSDLGRNPGEGNRPGRSRWPEPDTIRRATGRHAPEHPPVLPDGFPRADLGLPIVFHFKDPGDPDDATLQRSEKGRTRMASPVITKVVALRNGQYAPLVAVLNAPRVWDLGDATLTGTRGSVTATEPKDKAQPVKALHADDPRDAVIKQAERAFGAKAVSLP